MTTTPACMPRIELGSFDLALAIAFAVGAVRPALSAGLAWPCAIAAAGLAGTAIVDLIAGQTFGADEAQHLVAVAGAVLLCWQARTVERPRGTGPGGPAARSARHSSGPLLEVPLPGAAYPGAGRRQEIPRESADGAHRGGRVTEPAAGPGTRETVLTIEGMTCAACAARVQKKLNGLDGVSPR